MIVFSRKLSPEIQPCDKQYQSRIPMDAVRKIPDPMFLLPCDGLSPDGEGLGGGGGGLGVGKSGGGLGD